MNEIENREMQPKEDYVEGCFKENFKKPHICPVATGGWCKDFTKCRTLEQIGGE